MSNAEFTNRFAHRIEKSTSSPIRDILKHSENKKVISLSGGYPAPESFPVEIISSLTNQVLEEYGHRVLQYGKTEGWQPFLETIPSFLARENRQIKATPENIVVTTGSQQALDIIGRLFIDPGDKVAVGSPTYLGAIQAFHPSQPQYIEIPSDNHGIIPEYLNQAFIEHSDIKFFYSVPTFDNPTGRTMLLERRLKIAEILKRHGQLGFEDDPYSEIRFEGEHIPSLHSLAPENVIHLFTFSKTLAPGFRVGGMVAPKKVTEAANRLKQGMELFGVPLGQAIVAKYIKDGHLDHHVPKIIDLYRPRRDVMAQVIKDAFPDIFEFTIAQGGLFIWVNLRPEEQKYAHLFNMNEILDQAINTGDGVSFVPGSAFFANSQGKEPAMRLNFSNQTEEKIAEGVGMIGEILHQKLVS